MPRRSGRIRDRTRRFVRRTAGALAGAFSPHGGPTRASTGSPGWTLAWSRPNETRWRRGNESVDCFRFDDGYVATVTYAARNVTWQLTPGPVPLGGALAAAALYIQHDTTPQIDREGRPFIAVGDAGPRQVFEEIADEPVQYVYLDGVRTVEEFPGFIDTSAELERVFGRMSPARPRTLGKE